ncbi:hypothetical protein NP233_g9977 [Leucocoprinus birnbaumii]|uniref:NAD(P)-binding protein n=1 Tax=Leucocoprinus birnbaumii TaxID=56174 RepID=A0AAD5VMV2_9AGAR|nr:hypothetical protein NP233_g9977 [Leucocoprinus birnbaumii]
MITPTTIYFITGANRGIGLALIEGLLKSKSDIYIFAAARSSTPGLSSLVAEHPDKLSIVNFVAADEASNKAAAGVVEEKSGRVDVVLGVAGISDFMGTVDETPVDALEEHFRINVSGILVLYQAFSSLLRKSKNPKFIPFTSGVGSITSYINLPMGYTCYGASKVALNYLARKIHFENNWLTCFPLSPGVVRTGMALGNRKLDKSGILEQVQDSVMSSPEDAAEKLINIVESATRETHGGEFINVDGTKIPW